MTLAILPTPPDHPRALDAYPGNGASLFLEKQWKTD
jgi:hypothetical protein